MQHLLLPVPFVQHKKVRPFLHGFIIQESSSWQGFGNLSVAAVRSAAHAQTLCLHLDLPTTLTGAAIDSIASAVLL